MNINTETVNGTCRLQIEGEMTIFHAQELKDGILDSLENTEGLEVDLSRVSEIDTAGFQLLLMLRNESMRLHTSLQVDAYSPAILSLLELYGVSKEVFADVR